MSGCLLLAWNPLSTCKPSKGGSPEVSVIWSKQLLLCCKCTVWTWKITQKSSTLTTPCKAPKIPLLVKLEEKWKKSGNFLPLLRFLIQKWKFFPLLFHFSSTFAKSGIFGLLGFSSFLANVSHKNLQVYITLPSFLGRKPKTIVGTPTTKSSPHTCLFVSLLTIIPCPSTMMSLVPSLDLIHALLLYMQILVRSLDFDPCPSSLHADM